MDEHGRGMLTLPKEVEEEMRAELLKRISELEQQIEDYCCGNGCSQGTQT